MKEFDRVILIRERAEYTQRGLKVGDHGIILGDEIRFGHQLVYFDGEIKQDEAGVYYTTEINATILEEDLALE